MTDQSVGYARSGKGANQATVTLNVKTSLNSDIQNWYFDKYEDGNVAREKFVVYPPVETRNMFVRGDLVFRIVGQRDSSVFADFSGLIVPIGSVPGNDTTSGGLYFDQSQSIYSVVEFVGVWKNSKTHANGGSLLNQDNSNTPGHQSGSVFNRGTDTIHADSRKRIDIDDLLIWVAPWYKNQSQLAANHRFVARIEPLQPKHIQDLWLDSQFAMMDHILSGGNNTLKTKPITVFDARSKGPFMLGNSKGEALPVARLARTEFKRDLLNAMSVIHVLTSVGKVKVINVKQKKKDALMAYLMKTANAGNLAAAKADIDATDDAFYDTREYTWNGNAFTKSQKKQTAVSFYNLEKTVIAESLSGVCGLMADIGIYDKSGIISSGKASPLLRELASVLISIPIPEAAKNFEFPLNSIHPSRDGANKSVNAKLIASNFYSDARDARMNAHSAAYEQYRELNKRIIGRAVTASPGNPSGAELPRGSLNAPQVDVDIESNATLFY